MIAVILCACLGFVPQLLLHEAAHCFIYRLAGARVEAFVPWPHRYGGRFYFARVMPDRALSTSWELRNKVAPLLKSTAMLALWLGLGFGVGLWAVGLALWEAIDLINWWQGWIRRRPNDGGQARQLLADQD
jgi:hypothetical protein